MSQIITSVVPERATKLVNIGRAWFNKNPINNQPILNAVIDRQFKGTAIFSANDKILYFKNKQREGTKDADLRMAIELPITEADAIIAKMTSSTEPH